MPTDLGSTILDVPFREIKTGQFFCFQSKAVGGPGKHFTADEKLLAAWAAGAVGAATEEDLTHGASPPHLAGCALDREGEDWGHLD
ncbi:hypothetical protein PoB_002569100 [Plakobranchus ocellatus]|uniref:Uncharacterized protein n=1 Tax=Plakobranchus ocellatus TaxID=259542 RepID=A0AAV3ZJA2_9GAST|nr:hypothetical protein PoB_002569100 [Plakobranchus ocellatus]